MFEEYRVSSGYGYRTDPFTKKKTFHHGVDLVKGHNTPVKAFLSGEVIYSGEGKTGTGLGGYGNVVCLKDLNGCLHLYAHLHTVKVKKGQKVSKGTTIGTQGSTGKSTGSHLHYEVRRKSSPSYGYTGNESQSYDPTKYLNVKANTNKKYISLVDYLKDHGIDSSFNNRKILATKHGILNYRGTAEQNIKLLNILQG